MQSRKINNLIKAYALNGSSQGFLTQAYELKHDRVLNDFNILTFKLPNIVSLQTEQELIYKNNRFIVTQTVQTRDENGHKITEVEATSAFIDLSNKTVKKMEFISQSLSAGLTKILTGTTWTIGNVPTDTLLHSMSEENQSVLWLVREFARVTGYEVDFDTINRKVNYVDALGKKSGFTFRYRKNIKEIKKTAVMPTATVLFPYGRGELNIASVNNGLEYLEDYSWYVSMGVPLADAKKKYRKELVWQDDRFIYVGNLLRAGQAKLAELSRPQISYEANVIDISAENLDVGDYCTVIDDELGIRLDVRVVRLEQYPNEPWNNVIELNYLLPGITDEDANGGSSGSTSNEEVMILAKNSDAMTISSNTSRILSLAITSYSSTNLILGFNLIGKTSTSNLLSIIFRLNGEQVGPSIKQSANGWVTIGLPFTLTQVQDGSYYLDVYAQTDTGTVTVAKESIEMYAKGSNMLGGVSADRPDRKVVDDVDIYPVPILTVTDNVVATQQQPVTISPSENVDIYPIPILAITENLTVEVKNIT